MSLTLNIFCALIYLYFFSETHLQVRPADGIFMCGGSKNMKSHKGVPFLDVIKLKFNIEPIFIPQICQIFAQN